MVAEAWQVLEQSRVICLDLSQHGGTWFVLTSADRSVREAADPAGRIQLRLQGVEV